MASASRESWEAMYSLAVWDEEDEDTILLAVWDEEDDAVSMLVVDGEMVR